MTLETLAFTLIGFLMTVMLAMIGYIWKSNEKRQDATNDKVTAMQLEMSRIRENYVSKEDHRAYAEQLNKALDGISNVMRDLQKTMTERIDLILFEVGRNRHNDKQN